MPTLPAALMNDVSARMRLSSSTMQSLRIFGGTLLALGLGLWLVLHGQYNLVAATIYLGLFLLIAFWDKPLSLYIVVLYTFLLGDLRRILDITGEIPKLDPLLLVSPFFSLLLATPILMGLRLKDTLHKAIVGLMVVMTLEIFNPKQGPLIVGFGGAMYYLVPLLWFLLGWTYASIGLLRRLIIYGIVPLGVLSAIFGIIQTYVGYLPWQQAWLRQVGSHIASMYLGAGVLRAVGFSVNSVEFSSVLMVSCVTCMALFFAGKKPFILLVPLLGFGLFLSSSRSSVVYGIFGMAMAWTVSGRSMKTWIPRLIFSLIIGIGALAFSVTHAASEADAEGHQDSAAGLSTQHEVQGLAHPLDPKHSTAGLHSRMLLGGITTGFTYPIGYGLGSATLASGKLGGDASSRGSSEMDVSDIFITNGVIGGCLYLFIMVMVTRRASFLALHAPMDVGLPVAGTLACLIGNWLGLGRYGQTTYLWLIIGIFSRYASTSDPIRADLRGEA